MSAELNVGSWSTAAVPVTVEYSLVAIEEIRNAVIEGYQKFSRGGIEVGGLLYGTHEGDVVRVLAVRPIECQHALGPSFLLSDSDKDALQRQIENRSDSSLGEFAVVGWFVSHTRSDIQLTDEEVSIFDRYFPAPWQVTLVVRPGKAGSARAGFFVRDADGSLKREQSYQEFDFPDRIAGAFPRIPRERPERRLIPEFASDSASIEEHHAPLPAESPALGAASSSSVYFPSVHSNEAAAPLFSSATSGQDSGRQLFQEKDRSWSWLLVAFLVLATGAVAVIGMRYLNPFLDERRQDPLSLAVFEREGQLRIQWNQGAGTVKSAAKGVLFIKDGPDDRSVPLTQKDLTTGSFTYARKSGDVQIRLTVESSEGVKTEEASTFLGGMAAARDPDELDSVRLERDALQDENARLRADNNKQSDRIQQLERTIVILRSRLGIEDGQR